ncbi:MAG TPA: DUF58 domain-containing protein [Thermodesulfovibrionales bacterium]|nr:DUF58 domain-containing protein [Thermodesulfovibrionales bacterium]
MGDHTVDYRADTGPRVITITKAGWLYIAVTLLLGFSAVNTGNNLVYLIVAAFLSFMGISGFFGRRNLLDIHITVEFPDEIYARTSIPLKVTLHNNRRILPAFLIKAHFRNQSVLFPFVDAKARGITYVTTTFDERGMVKINDIRLCSVFPFHFFIRCRKIERAVEVTVFPHAKKCELPVLFERERQSRGERSIDRAGYEAEIMTMRDYIKGDPIKYIHWKATAKTGKLKTKELSTLAHQPVVIDMDAVPIKNMEERVSCVTYIILRLLRQNIPVGLKINGAFYKPLKEAQGERLKINRINMLKALAVYDKG